jgi:hypothetical protein
MAERRSHYEQGGEFMRSGFQRWAENERPARQGGAKKEAAEVVSTKAGKDILDRVKSLGEDMFAHYYKGSARHIKGQHEESESDEEQDMEGGAAMAVGVEEYEPRSVGTLGKGYSGNGKLEVIHHETGHGTEIKAGKGKGKGKVSGSVHAPDVLGMTMDKKAPKATESVPKAMDGAGRSARAAIVKKVMKEKGLSLIEASKYVKQHGLYKK